MEDVIAKLKKEIADLAKQVSNLQSIIDEHLLEHMIEDRNKEFDLDYPFEDE